MFKLLIVEDETNVRKPLADYLQKEGFEIIEASSLSEGELKMQNQPDLVLLDWMLPDGQGIELLKKWRHQSIEIPVLMLTARADIIDKVLGLELGANDYITKPFEPRELVARIRVRLRERSALCSPSQSKEKVLLCGDFSLNLQSRVSTYQNKVLDLTKTEFDLLRLFIENPDQVFSREELLKSVWGYDQYPSTRTVDTHIMQLRQKSNHEHFETVHGIGYRFRATKI